MSACLLMIGDGRSSYHVRSLRSALQHLPEFDQHVLVDDHRHRLGFAGAIEAAWAQVETDHVFHLELDFTFCEPVDLAAMIELLDWQPTLAQVVLKRQPWNDRERAAGGIVEADPDDFEERRDGAHVWTEHRRFFSTNPSVYSSRLCRLGWPQEQFSEGVFTHRLLRDPHTRFAFWGGKFDQPRVEHIGDERKGTGY